MAPNYRFARSLRWVASHVAVVLLIVAMVAAGWWQIERHRSRSERNQQVRDRSELPVVDVASVATPQSPTAVGHDQEFTRVRVEGHYVFEDEVLVRNRTFEGAPGWWVLTPVLTDAGWGVVVNRGWIPLSYKADEARPGTEPPTGRVVLDGWIQPSRTAEGFQRADPGEGTLTSLARPDIERLGRQLDYDVVPLVVRVDQADNEPGGLPVPLPLPPLDGGPHASYAVQWFIFSTIALIGYPLVLRRVASGRGASLPEAGKAGDPKNRGDNISG